MKFADYAYQRPNMAEMETKFNDSLSRFSSAGSSAEQSEAMGAINTLRAEFDTMASIAHVRHTVNTTDEFYKEEQDFYDEHYPIYQGWITKYYEALIASPFKNELEAVWGKQLFALANLAIKTFSPEVVEDLQQENKLASEYVKLIASAKIPFEGEERTLSELAPFTQSEDRNMRKRASEARYGFFVDNESKLDDIYDQLVKVRTKIAHKLGYDNFVQLAYDRMNRTDYNAAMVANFRRQVKDQLVSISSKLYERQRNRIGVDKLQYYDLGFHFASGNAKPQGGPEWQLEQAKTMYDELSPETGAFFKFMTDNGLLDIESKKGKAGGGYCTSFSKYEAPFIFANFNGTAHDVTVLTHEAGHALQVYSSMHFEVPEYHWPTYEACEIHSMSMEFFTWPWMNLFFKEDTDKFKFYHLSSSLQFIPYGVTVDEFQHYVYENPEASPAERKAAWRAIERKYLPNRNYEENDFLERGGFWLQQGHIFSSPFYYIDYTLAQLCAFQFWKRIEENKEEAWADYMALCRAGGSKPFTELVAEANLTSPFADGCVASVVGHIESYLSDVDDTKL